MKVSELVGILEQEQPDAEVLVFDTPDKHYLVLRVLRIDHAVVGPAIRIEAGPILASHRGGDA